LGRGLDALLGPKGAVSQVQATTAVIEPLPGEVLRKLPVGQLQPGNVVKVKQHDGSEVELKGTNVIIAAGSDSIELPFAKFDGETIVDNVGGLDFTEVPNRLAVIGAGVIGLELGSVWKRLGA
ncbi:FAD-dependent oxidoreductase, partial [Mesorhizobium sp. M4B.F.Ca.ET.203.01.1.1]|uniref:FAD-dependent oxidoreductase n=1 Tax=Mesorhizobium sp. M4B.F.Ca.ET.203.01.1.1 TaxID=2563953 RepID=UPI001AEE899D